MPDKIGRKVVNIFEKHKKNLPLEENESVVEIEDGIICACFKTDDNGHHFDEKVLMNRAESCQYIVRVMVKKAEHPYIYNYKIAGNKLLDFLKGYLNGEQEGTIIEIENYFPTSLA